MRTIFNTAAAPTLNDLPRWGRGLVAGVRGEGPSADRLRELGFTPGTEVVFVRKAPLGDPLCFRVRGVELCLRREEAATVEIRPAEAP